MTRDEFNKMRGVVPSTSKESMQNEDPSTESLHGEGKLTGNEDLQAEDPAMHRKRKGNRQD